MKYNNDEIDLLKGVIDIDEFLKKNGIIIDYKKLPPGIFSPRMTIPFSKSFEIAYLDEDKHETKGKKKEKTDALQRIQSLDERIENASDENLKLYMQDFEIYTSNAGIRKGKT